MMTDAADWAKALEYGLGVASLGWVGIYVIIPLRDRHTKFLDSVERTNEQLAGTISKQADLLQGMQDGLEKMNDKIDKMEQVVEKLSIVTQHLRTP